mmetsp:Transcript_17482/g.24893  ORF Transcript_17482/g.24893 Transcript_17482/m.24893 type:complete len:718 (+) Transcript_17482:92-2245(+)
MRIEISIGAILVSLLLSENDAFARSSPNNRHWGGALSMFAATDYNEGYSSSSSKRTTSFRASTLSADNTQKNPVNDDDALLLSDENLALLSERGRASLLRFVENDRKHFEGANQHVYSDWPEVGVEDEGKIRLAEQLADLDESYPGGLTSYIAKARQLLKESSQGVNPFDEYTASIPKGEILTYEPGHNNKECMSFSDAEDIGMTGIANVAFVLVAGGLGERLGFSGIKLALETNLCTDVCYLKLYCKFIQAFHRMAQIQVHHETPPMPLVIMTSLDTDAMTRKLLEDNDNFGMAPGQISIVCQDKVPALKDSNAGLSYAGSSRWEIETKPHGHGDVHHLLLKHGLVDQWLQEGRKYVIFLQDTNALVINAILPALGVTIAKKFHMNSICIPRLAGEAAGAIARLEHKTDPAKSLTINVEYNQLDPLLKSNPPFLGDVAPDPTTGLSPYPGNANNLIFELKSYAKTLQGEDQGVVIEFVNPKYKEGSRTEFKKPTRLECMMQDFPKLMQKEMGSEANVGFTMFERWYSFSPAKNSFEAGMEHVSKGGMAPGTMCSAESDKYISNQRKLRFAGVDVPVTTHSEDYVYLAGIPITPGPRIVLCPAFAITQNEIVQKISGGKITKRSSLVLEGEELFVRNLDLDGALEIRTGHGCHVTVDGLQVRNKGWELQKIPEGATDIPESVAIRGYTMKKHDAMIIHITEPGRYVIGEDGIVKKRD